jgi:hypothetical protein
MILLPLPAVRLAAQCDGQRLQLPQLAPVAEGSEPDLLVASIVSLAGTANRRDLLIRTTPAGIVTNIAAANRADE